MNWPLTNIWEKAISILTGNLNSGGSYLITTVHGNDLVELKTMIWLKVAFMYKFFFFFFPCGVKLDAYLLHTSRGRVDISDILTPTWDRDIYVSVISWCCAPSMIQYAKIQKKLQNRVWMCQLYLIRNAQNFMKNKIINRFEIGLQVIIDNHSE